MDEDIDVQFDFENERSEPLEDNVQDEGLGDLE